MKVKRDIATTNNQCLIEARYSPSLIWMTRLFKNCMIAFKQAVLNSYYFKIINLEKIITCKTEFMFVLLKYTYFSIKTI